MIVSLQTSSIARLAFAHQSVVERVRRIYLPHERHAHREPVPPPQRVLLPLARRARLHLLQRTDDDPTQHLTVRQIPIPLRELHKVRERVGLHHDEARRVVRVPVRAVPAHAEEHPKRDARDRLARVSEVDAALLLVFRVELFDEATADASPHRVQLGVRLRDAVLVVREDLAHDRAVRQREQLRVLWFILEGKGESVG
eukprot:30925-Pelagococcus_subviridis.AAC.14